VAVLPLEVAVLEHLGELPGPVLVVLLQDGAPEIDVAAAAVLRGDPGDGDVLLGAVVAVGDGGALVVRLVGILHERPDGLVVVVDGLDEEALEGRPAEVHLDGVAAAVVAVAVGGVVARVGHELVLEERGGFGARAGVVGPRVVDARLHGGAVGEGQRARRRAQQQRCRQAYHRRGFLVVA